MVNKLKIITMTRLALYDKHEGPADRAANDYFRHDYIYRNNLGTRLAVGLGGIIILAVYWLQSFFINEMDIFELDITQYATESFLFILAILAVYSLIGTIQGTRQYYLVQKRLAQYQALVRQLERLEERAHRTSDETELPSPHKDAVTFRNDSTATRKGNIGRQARNLQPERTRPPVRTRPAPPPPLPEHDTIARPLRPRPQPQNLTSGDAGPPIRPRSARPPAPPPIEHTRIPRPKPPQTTLPAGTETPVRPRPKG